MLGFLLQDTDRAACAVINLHSPDYPAEVIWVQAGSGVRIYLGKLSMESFRVLLALNFQFLAQPRVCAGVREEKPV